MGFSHRQTEDEFQSSVCAVIWVWQLPLNYLSIVAVPWGPGTQVSLATRAKESKGILCVDCTHVPGLPRLWETVEGWSCPQV